MRIRFRIDGALHDALSLPAEIGPALISRIKIMAGLNIAERRLAQDGRIRLRLSDRELDLRAVHAPDAPGDAGSTPVPKPDPLDRAAAR